MTDAPPVLTVKYFASLLLVTGFGCGNLSNSMDRLSTPSFAEMAATAACGLMPSLTPAISNCSASAARGGAAWAFAMKSIEMASNHRGFIDVPVFQYLR